MRASATARLTESVVLPTPPLPEPTVMMASTPGSGWGPCGCDWGFGCVCEWATGLPCAIEDTYRTFDYRGSAPDPRMPQKPRSPGGRIANRSSSMDCTDAVVLSTIAVPVVIIAIAVGMPLALSPSRAEHVDRRDAVAPVLIGIVLGAPAGEIRLIAAQVDANSTVSGIVESHDFSATDHTDT